jgi:hypothetical protein
MQADANWCEKARFCGGFLRFLASWPPRHRPRFRCLEAYRANIKTANAIALDDSPIVPFLRTLVEQKDWPELEDEKRSPTQLFSALTALAGGTFVTHRMKGWPPRPGELMKLLNRLGPALRRSGIDFDSDRSPGDNRDRWVRVWRTDRDKKTAPE